MVGRRNPLSGVVLRSVLDQLSLAVFVFRREQLIYTNPPATRLITRLRAKYRIELLVMLLDHLAQTRDRSTRAETAIALTGQDNEPFSCTSCSAVDDTTTSPSASEIGSDIAAFKGGPPSSLAA